MKYNKQLREAMDEIARVAGYLWQQGWAERNGGNISYNITGWDDARLGRLKPLTPQVRLPQAVGHLKGGFFIVTGTGCRMRHVAERVMDNAAIIRISADGTGYCIVAEQVVMPTSELPSHLMIHDYLKAQGRDVRVVMHTHPTELVAMTHNPKLLGKDVLSKLLWSMIPETRAFCPKGVGIVPYTLPGSVELARRSIEQLEKHDVVLWEKHGALAVGENLTEAFDMVDTLSKSAKIYVAACSMGFKPEGMSDAQMDELARAFDLPG